MSYTLPYRLNLTGKHLDVTDGMREHLMEKLSKLEKLSDQILDLHVVMEVQKLEHRVDMIVHLHHTKVKVHAITSDMYLSIDQAFRKLQSQIRRYAKKLREHYSRPRPVKEMPVQVIMQPSPGEQEWDEPGAEVMATVVKEETRPLRTLTSEEAIMKMELSQDQFMIYHDVQEHSIKVIYKRLDGNYGIIGVKE